jgi:hypothetical protein
MRKYRMTPNECNSFLHTYTNKYNEDLDNLLKELIAESPEGKIPIILQRNPTLVRLSAQHLYITKIKTDPDINTTSMSVLALKGPNAD